MVKEKVPAMKKAYKPRNMNRGILEQLGDSLLVGTLIIDTSLVEDSKAYVSLIRDQFIAKGYRVEVMPLNNNDIYNFTYRRNE